MFTFNQFYQGVIIGLMVVVPFIIIYKRAGYNPLWAGMVFLPVFGLLLVCLQLALTPWPNQANRGGKE